VGEHREACVPLYEDLARRVVAARQRSEQLQREFGRASELARLLRDARADRVILVHCAWCDAFHLGDEWLQLEAIGDGQVRIIHTLRDKASHGICPSCLDEQLELSAAHRRQPATPAT
jgi:hypothetical protein